MARSKTLHEILQVKSRAPRGLPHTSRSALDNLARAWNDELKGRPYVAELLPARIVTVLEVCVRGWVEHLIDHGTPFVERAATLKLDLKFDFALASSIHGGVITLGQIIAHSISTSKLENIKSTLDALIADDLYQISAIVTR